MRAGGRALTLHPTTGATGGAHATLELPVPRTGKWIVTPRVMRRGGAGRGTLQLISHGRSTDAGDAKLIWEWKDDDGGTQPGKDSCIELPPKEAFHGVDLDATPAPNGCSTATGGDVTIDQTIAQAGRGETRRPA